MRNRKDLTAIHKLSEKIVSNPTMDFDDALAEDMVDFIEDWLYDEFYEKVLSFYRTDTADSANSGQHFLVLFHL